ncbi:MAG: hydrogenase iron-sulfur subunit [Candidatus Riflebacteria bacterium]|nr:hydrogenase iron-sulfur subunit [Candidatus Riflebacteria bacterium]
MTAPTGQRILHSGISTTAGSGGGWVPCDCHHISGHCRASAGVRVFRQILGRTGAEPDRLRLDWPSVAERERLHLCR